MKLTLQSWGGFAGPASVVTRTVDLGTLQGAQAGQALALARAAHLFDQAEKQLLAAPKPWDFNYALEADDGKQVRRIQLHLGAADGALRALVEWMESEAPAS